MSTLDLFSSLPKVEPASEGVSEKQRALGQFMTASWVAHALIAQHFGDLGTEDVVLEPTCGEGAFLSAIPSHVPAIGIEVDPALADRARARTGRRVITGDAREVVLDFAPTAMVGNLPFEMKVVDGILDRARDWLPKDGRFASLLPAYALQTPSRVARYNDDWSIEATMVPRTLFKGLQCPLSWVMFRRDSKRLLIGMALYQECLEVEAMADDIREKLEGSPGTWRDVVGEALDRLGGRARLEDVYRVVEPRRPTKTAHWREQVRKVIRQHFTCVGFGEYALAA